MTNPPLTLTALTLALSFAAQGVDARMMNYLGDPDVNWPFENHFECLGSEAERELMKPLLDYSRERMEALGQPARSIFTRGNRNKFIYIEQYLATREYIVEQCDLRAAGLPFDATCPINHLPLEEALDRADAIDDDFWSVHSSELRDRKEPLQERWEAVRNELIRGCGHDD